MVEPAATAASILAGPVDIDDMHHFLHSDRWLPEIDQFGQQQDLIGSALMAGHSGCE